VFKFKTEIPSVFYIHDLDDGLITWYGDVKNFFGLEAQEISTRNKYLELLNEKDRENYENNISNFIEEIACEYTIKCKGKDIQIKEFSFRSNNKGKNYLQGIISLNHSGKTEAGQGKYNVSLKSILTGKFDSVFLDTLKKYFIEGHKNKNNYVLLIISIDNLPMIINWQGEAVASAVIHDLFNRIKELLNNESEILNVSANQYGIILKNPTSNEIDIIVNNISKLISLYKHPNLEDSVHLRLSIGSIGFPLGVKDEVDIINKAYLALTNAKSKEYEFYCDFEDAKREHIDAQNEMSQLHYLQEAFQQNRIFLAYQPIIKSSDGDVDSYECLLRISDGRGRFESAGRLIKVAEKMGTVETIDEFVLRTGVEELKKNKNFKISINVSNITTSSDEWLKMCTKELFDEEIAKRITFEITETAAQKDLRKTAYFTAAIQALGCEVSLDDFGVGFTSFRQLRSLSINSIKIDGSFVLGLEENKENLIFIRSLIDFGKSYGLKTVAECVENGEVAKKLIDLGVDYMQGYYFGVPDVKKPWLKAA
jgi:EAL domain-containing protein (putative c-di-GMP-specific phosphodiesterase class I)/GGDEF domain-containing protein